MIQAGVNALEKYGAGLSSVRFICGTQDIHKVFYLHNFVSVFKLTKWIFLAGSGETDCRVSRP